MPHSELGEFLRTRRAKVSPDLLGIAAVGHRRVQGLRRDEVAVDAGISSDYYRRIEQGREPHPSESIVVALSRTLQLTSDEQKYLFSLAGLAWRLEGNDSSPQIPTELLGLLDSWEHAGAMVLDPVLDILAMNARARDLFGGFSNTKNLLEMVLLDKEARRFFVDWQASAAGTVANLRASADFSRAPARFRDLVALLQRTSPEFPALWERHDVKAKSYDTKHVHHHRDGLLSLKFHAFGVPSAPGHQLLVYQID